jgi:3',5'-cyclic-AMP phosphodiesterase
MDFSFIQITDHHLTESDAEFLQGYSTRYALRRVLREIAQGTGPHADFMISTGDLVEKPTETAYRAARELLGLRNAASAAPGPLSISAEGLQELPLYVLPGNHDDRQHFFAQLFPGHLPNNLLNATFVHKGVQFICLDWGPHTKAVAYPETLHFLARALETEMPSVIMMHHQVVRIGSRWLDDFIADGVEQFWNIIRGRQVLGVFCGHLHSTYEQVVEHIPVFGLRSTAPSFVLQDEPLACLLPPHYRVVSLRDGRLTTQIQAVSL